MFIQIQAAWAQAYPPPLALTAQSWILYDVSTDQVLRQYRADQRINASNFAKLLLVYMVFDAIQHNTLRPEQALPKPPLDLHFSAGNISKETPQTVNEALQALLLPEQTTAAPNLAVMLAGSVPEAYRWFDRESQRIGLKHTQFRNLRPHETIGHYTTVRDLARLATRIQQDFPQQSRILFQRKDLVVNGLHWPNPNHLLWLDPNVDGLISSDTGGIVTATRGSRHLVAVVLGETSPTRISQDCLQLLNSGFQDFETVRLYSANQNISPLEVRHGRLNYVRTGFLQDFNLALVQGKTDDLQFRLTSRNPLLAPVRKGDVLGTLTITQDGQLIGAYPVRALQDVPATNWLGRRWDDLTNWLRQER